MAKVSGVLTGTAGVYYVASQLAAQGFHAAITHGNAPSVDILVALPDGSSAVSLQVKTSSEALVLQGKKPNKIPYYYQWRMSEHSALLNHPDLFFALVNLRLSNFVSVESGKQALPEVFVVPSTVVHDVHEAYPQKDKKSAESWWWCGPQKLKQYKNNWDLLHNYLAGKVSPSV